MPQLRAGRYVAEIRAVQRRWLRAGAARIVGAVRATGSALVWSFTGPVPAGYWLRRTAHETLVHRADARLAAGDEPEPVIDAEVAADAIDEWLMLVTGGLGDAGERAGALPAGAGLHVHVTDDGLGGRGDDGPSVCCPAQCRPGPAASDRIDRRRSPSQRTVRADG
jgi:hypothetical protein